MDPDDRDYACGSEPDRHFPHALSHASPVFAMPNGLVKPIRRAQEKPEGKSQAIEEIAQTESF